MFLALVFLAAAAVSSYGARVDICNDIDFVTNLNNNFGQGLLELLGEGGGNVFFSPASLSSLLSAIFFGARGQTAEDLVGFGYLAIQYENFSSIDPLSDYCLELLRTFESQSDAYTIQRANAILVERDFPVLQEYKDILGKTFGSVVKEVDFSGQRTVGEVNRWVKEKTHGKISKLVEVLDEDTRLLLLSAVYFNGTWQTQFDPKNTKPRPFHNNGNASPKFVPTMNLHAKFPYLYDAQNRYRAVLLPYKGDDLSMLILLPFERDGMERLQKILTFTTITDVLRKLQETEIIVYLPKFKLEYSKSLKDALTRSGLGAMFSSNADFSGITGAKDLYVSDVVHKAVVEVNEEGTEAAAVTGGMMIPMSMETPWNVLNADHPFLFFIIDNRSSSNLFVGRVNEL